MKITFDNFKCYIHKEFEFPEEGLVLISAPSGSGKSTILEGILFVLFGIGKKLQTWGKKSCKVQLWFDNIHVTRTKCPNRLVVKTDNTYEDAAAQGIIDSKFGNIFPTTSFIDNHNLYKSFLLLTPSEKLSFLEKFAFQDADLIEINKKIKQKINEKKQLLDITQGKINVTEEILEQTTKPEDLEFPIKVSEKNKEKIIKNIYIKKKNSDILIKKNTNKIQDLKDNLVILEKDLIKNNNLQERIDILKKKKDKYLTEKTLIKIIPNKEFEELQNILSFITKNRDLSNLQKNYNEQKKNLKILLKKERTNLQEKIKEIKTEVDKIPVNELENKLGNLNVIKIKAIDYEKYIKEIKQYEDICEEDITNMEETLKENREDIVSLTKKLELIKISKQCLDCPNCNSKLYYTDNKLYLFDCKEEIGQEDEEEDIIERIKSSENNINYLVNMIIKDKQNLTIKKSLEEKINNILEFLKEQGIEKKNINSKKFTEEIENINNDLALHNQSIIKLQDLKLKFDKEEYNDVITELKNLLEITKNTIEEMTSSLVPAKNPDNLSEEELIEKINFQNIELQKLENVNIKLNDIEQEISDLEEKIEEEYKDNINNNIIELKNTIEETENTLIKLKENKINIENTIKNIEEYQNYIKELDKYNQLLNRLNILKKEEQKVLTSYKASITFKQKVLESESNAIHNIIESINNYANIYLELFFTEDPINIMLSAFKEVKNKDKSKAQINVNILYKESECDISSLSGGELARAVLAFTLALGDMFNTPLLLLDECTASLDSENTQNIFNCVKTNFNNKLVLVIAHQVIEGGYDHVIKL